jgi:hypothetical protein
MRKALTLLTAAAALAACGGEDAARPQDSARTSEASAAPEPEADASAQLACRHFRNVMGDFDVLTVPELRAKLQEVHETASVSVEPGVAEHARGLLSAVTAEDGDAFLVEAQRLSDACAAAGL